MSHAPVHYSITAPSAAALAAMTDAFDTGDTCYVAGLTEFTYDKASAAVVDNVNVIDGPASVGRWLRGPAPGSVGDAAIDATSKLAPLVTAPAAYSPGQVAHVVKVQPVESGGYIGVRYEPAKFGTQVDCILHFGYHANGVAGEPSIWHSVEHDYWWDDGAGHIAHTSEAHIQFLDQDNQTTRPITANLNRGSGAGKGRVAVTSEFRSAAHDATDPIPDAYWRMQDAGRQFIFIHIQGTAYDSDWIALGDKPAGSGAIRLSNLAMIRGRKADNSGDATLLWLDSLNRVTVGDGNAPVLEYINGSNTRQWWSGDGFAAAQIDRTGVVTAHKGMQIGDTGGPTWTSGNGSPEGVVTAPVGSLYSRLDGGAGTTLYVKQSGSGNTGWAAK